MAPPEEVTQLLRMLEAGNAAAGEALAVKVYPQLYHLARRAMAREDRAATLQPTALVHEAWLRLFPDEPGEHWRSRGHFLAVVARVMRHVLVDHARARKASKRGAGRREALDVWIDVIELRSVDTLELHEALEKLTALDEQLARIVELRFFTGATILETARALDVSEATVERGWRTARAWLRGELDGD